MPSQISKKNNRWLSQGAGSKFSATNYGTSTIPEESNIPYNALAKKKTKKSIEREMAKENKFRALDAFAMW